MTDTQELKPCPFCGRSPRHTYHRYSESWKVECSWDCPSETSSTDKQLAIKAWNTRAALPGDAASTTLPVEKSVGAEGNREAPYAASLNSALVERVSAAALGKIAFEKHMEDNSFSHPRLGMKSATWDELPPKIQGQWGQVANAVTKAHRTSPSGINKAEGE